MKETNRNPWPTLPLIWSAIGIAYAIYYNLEIG